VMPGGGGASPIARVYVRMHCGRRRTTDKRARTARPRAPRLEDEVEPRAIPARPAWRRRRGSTSAHTSHWALEIRREFKNVFA